MLFALFITYLPKTLAALSLHADLGPVYITYNGLQYEKP
jgi:hypothetical protein